LLQSLQGRTGFVNGMQWRNDEEGEGVIAIYLQSPSVA